VSEDRVLKRVFGPKWKEVVGGWKRLNDEELHNFYASPDIIIIIIIIIIIFRVIKARSMRWMGM
jgi:hypothetical protein